MKAEVAGGIVNRVLLVRQGHAVDRLHTERIIGGQTNGDHSAGVAALLIEFTEGEASAKLLMAAIHHDVAEAIFGDVPAPAKWWQIEAVKKELEFAELEFAANAGLWTKLLLTEQERDLLRLADKMELMFYCLEQRQMGNTHVGHVFWNLVNHLSELGAVEMAPEPAQEIFTYLIDSYPEGSESVMKGVINKHHPRSNK